MGVRQREHGSPLLPSAPRTHDHDHKHDHEHDHDHDNDNHNDINDDHHDPDHDHIHDDHDHDPDHHHDLGDDNDDYATDYTTDDDLFFHLDFFHPDSFHLDHDDHRRGRWGPGRVPGRSRRDSRRGRRSMGDPSSPVTGARIVRRSRLHAGAWWLWAIGLVVAATRTRNPLLLGAILAVSGLVVAARRPTTAWAGGYRFYLQVAGVVVAVRTAFRILLGGGFGTEVLFTLPAIAAGGVEVGGPVTLEAVVAGLYDGLRLATIIACIGAANTLADPRRLIGSLPKALGGVATSIVVALSVAPHLVESLHRVRRARRLRGEAGQGWRSIRSLLVPVLEDSLQRSLALAVSMQSRGYGRLGDRPTTRRWATPLAWIALATLATGMFGLLGLAPSPLWWVLIGIGVGSTVAALALTGRGVVRTRYRPDRWDLAAWLVTGSGLVAAIGTFLADPTHLNPTVVPLVWPQADPVALTAMAVAAAPAVMAPTLTRAAPLPDGAPA